MKLVKILIAALFFSGSIFAIDSINAAPKSIVSAMRVRTVPSSTDQKKKEKENNSVKQPTNNGTTTTTKKCSQSNYVLSSLYIGKGGKPK